MQPKQASGTSRKHCYKTYYMTCRPRLYRCTNLSTTGAIGPVFSPITRIDRSIFLALTSAWIAPVGPATFPKCRGCSRGGPRVFLPLQCIYLGGVIGVVHVIGEGWLARDECVIGKEIFSASSNAATRAPVALAHSIGLGIVWSLELAPISVKLPVYSSSVCKAVSQLVGPRNGVEHVA